MKYKNLFSPFKLGNVDLKSKRITSCVFNQQL